MNSIVIVDKQMEQEFAYVDSIINAHTNSAIAKVNAEALQTYWEVGQFVSERLHSSRWGEHAVDRICAISNCTNYAINCADSICTISTSTNTGYSFP